MSALTKQSGGSHYKDLAIQPVEYIHANGIGYMEGNVIKYLSRWKSKGGISDLEKAKHYIELLIELEANKEAVDAPKPAELGDGWIQWNGGECPVPARTRVDIRFRRGGDECNRIAEALEWKHGKLGWWWDIVAYRIVNPAT